MTSLFSQRVLELIKSIPSGKVATYGQIALLAGNPAGARQVVRLLHSLSEKEMLPWHRVINSKGTISLTAEGYELQRSKLEQEGVEFDLRDRVDLKRFLWKPQLDMS